MRWEAEQTIDSWKARGAKVPSTPDGSIDFDTAGRICRGFHLWTWVGLYLIFVCG